MDTGDFSKFADILSVALYLFIYFLVLLATLLFFLILFYF